MHYAPVHSLHGDVNNLQDLFPFGIPYFEVYKLLLHCIILFYSTLSLWRSPKFGQRLINDKSVTNDQYRGPLHHVDCGILNLGPFPKNLLYRISQLLSLFFAKYYVLELFNPCCIYVDVVNLRNLIPGQLAVMAKLTEPMKMNEDVESWLEILEQAIEHLLIMEDITDSIRVRKVKVSCLITNIGPDGYKLLKSYCAPRLPKNLEFEELVRLLKDNLVPKPVHSSRLQMTFQFEQMKQESKESLGMFMSRLTQQANLGCLPDIMVRNRFLNGMKNQQVQSYLLTLREDDVNTSNQVLEKAAEKENKIFEEKIKQKNSLTEGK